MDSVSAHASVEAEMKSPLADAISRAAADRRKDARPIFLQDTPAKDNESTGPPAWMCALSMEGGGSMLSGTPRAGSHRRGRHASDSRGGGGARLSVRMRSASEG